MTSSYLREGLVVSLGILHDQKECGEGKKMQELQSQVGYATPTPTKSSIQSVLIRYLHWVGSAAEYTLDLQDIKD